MLEKLCDEPAIEEIGGLLGCPLGPGNAMVLGLSMRGRTSDEIAQVWRETEGQDGAPSSEAIADVVEQCRGSLLGCLLK